MKKRRMSISANFWWQLFQNSKAGPLLLSEFVVLCCIIVYLCFCVAAIVEIL